MSSLRTDIFENKPHGHQTIQIITHGHEFLHVSNLTV